MTEYEDMKYIDDIDRAMAIIPIAAVCAVICAVIWLIWEMM